MPVDCPFLPGQEITLGLSTHNHQGFLWLYLPQKNVTHVADDRGLMWELVDNKCCVETIFPMITCPSPMKVKFLELIECTDEQWGSTMLKVALGKNEYFVSAFLANNPILTLPSPVKETAV